MDVVFIVTVSSTVAIGVCLLAMAFIYALYAQRRGFNIVDNPPLYRSVIKSICADTISFHPRGKDVFYAQLPIVGLVSRKGSMVLIGPSKKDGNNITRKIDSIDGSIEIGDGVSTDRFIYQNDPMSSLGIPFEKPLIDTELGELESWLIRGNSDRWVVCVHGHRSSLKESLRFLPILKKMNMNILMINYRNSWNTHVEPNQSIMIGLTEWRDLENAVKWCLQNRANQITLLGHSMGGGIVWKYLVESELAEKVDGVILESPLLDLNEVANNIALRIPGFGKLLLWPVKQILAKKNGFNWDDLKYIDQYDKISTPIFLIHSEADRIVPISTSDKLAQLRPDLVTYLRLQKSPHAAAWNVYQNEVEKGILEFLKTLIRTKKP